MLKILVETEDVQRRLAELGLEEKSLADIVRRGHVAYASSTLNDPPLFPGFSAWATMVRGLREYLCPEWQRLDDNNYSLVVNPSGTVAIAVATGDAATGLRNLIPTNKSAKGPSTADAVESNQQQLDFGPMPVSEPVRAVNPENQRMTWILLVYRAENEVRYELSLPTSMGIDGRVDAWRERIILAAVPVDPAALHIVSPQPLLPDIAVEVKRRT